MSVYSNCQELWVSQCGVFARNIFGLEDPIYHISQLQAIYRTTSLLIPLSLLLIFPMTLKFEPPLLNSANPWATSQEDLQALYDCPHTGALTTRTSTTDSFDHDDTIHQYCFFHSQEHEPKQDSIHGHSPSSAKSISSLNTLGYSPLSTKLYLRMIYDIILQSKRKIPKPVIFSVTGTPKDILMQYYWIDSCQDQIRQEKSMQTRFFMEINLSCPNIAGKPPPAYSKAALGEYLVELSGRTGAIEVGIKTPPYTYQTQFDEIIFALLESAANDKHKSCPISFITATNTLGNCLVLSETSLNSSPTVAPAINSSTGTGIGGLAGSSLHPLALGNVATLRRMLDAHKALENVDIIGVGGVSDAAGYKRMKAVGAAVVAVGTALGVEGTSIFEKIWKGVEQEE